MFRLAWVIALIGCITALSYAQESQDNDQDKDKGPAAATVSQPPAQTVAVAAVKTQNPLDAFQDFSAKMIGSAMEIGEGTTEGYIYRSGKLMRMTGPELHGYFITDLSTSETYGISAGPCMYDTHAYLRANPFGADAKPGTIWERSAVGKETVDGHSCQVEDITISSPSPARPRHLRFWEAEDLQGFPIKIEFMRPGGHNPIVHYKNVVLGPQDPTLFLHPKSCEPLPNARKPLPGSSPKMPGPLTPKKAPPTPPSDSPQQ